MVDVLWTRGEKDQALALEDLWNELLARLPVRLLCGYTIEGFESDGDVDGLRRVCARHRGVAPVEARDAESWADPQRLLAELQLRRRHAEREVERRRELEHAARGARDLLRAAHERLTRLQTVTAALSEAVTLDDIGRVVVSETARVVGAERAILAAPEGTRTLRVLARGGSPDATTPEGRFTLDDPLPLAESYRTQEAVWIGSRAALGQRYPGLPAAVCALGCIPINVGGRPLGVVGFEFAGERRFSGGERALMQDLARQIGVALDRARLYEAARRSETKLQEAGRRKDEFLALLGHELRNPLAPIMTAVQLMKLRGEAALDRERAVIERQVLHLSRLVDDLLDVSRITQGKLELKKAPVEISAVLAQAVELASPLIEQRAHRLVVEKPAQHVWVEADATRLAQALANLLSNAAKYTEPGGHIAVKVSDGPGEVRLGVKDSGAGIRSELLATIFEPFVQVERTLERAQGGLGLGLAIVKSLVELHGGRVHAFSEGVGQGSEFSITIPSMPSTGPVSSRSSLAAPRRRVVDAAAMRRVLVVDDNPDAADGMGEMLGMLGHEAHVAYDGVAALEKAGGLGFDVAVLDVNLPVMDGYELARRMREQPGNGRMRFIAVTGFGTEEDHERSRAAGFSAHLVKPIDYERLLKLLEAR
jgi:signal transduction histidine kinase/CheY-like chemotaxis protein